MAIIRFYGDHLAALVASGAKRRTLRVRTRPPAIGARLTLMRGPRRLVDPDPACAEAFPVSVRTRGASLLFDGEPNPALVRSLGHADEAAAADYYARLNGLRFEAWVIGW